MRKTTLSKRHKTNRTPLSWCSRQLRLQPDATLCYANRHNHLFVAGGTGRHPRQLPSHRRTRPGHPAQPPKYERSPKAYKLFIINMMALFVESALAPRRKIYGMPHVSRKRGWAQALRNHLDTFRHIRHIRAGCAPHTRCNASLRKSKDPARQERPLSLTQTIHRRLSASNGVHRRLSSLSPQPC